MLKNYAHFYFLTILGKNISLYEPCFLNIDYFLTKHENNKLKKHSFAQNSDMLHFKVSYVGVLKKYAKLNHYVKQLSNVVSMKATITSLSNRTFSTPTVSFPFTQ